MCYLSCCLQVAAQALNVPLSKVFISETSTDKVRGGVCVGGGRGGGFARIGTE